MKNTKNPHAINHIKKYFNEKIKGAMRKIGKGMGRAEQKRKEQKYNFW